VLVLDPLAPPNAPDELWARLDARPPTAAVVLKPDTCATSTRSSRATARARQETPMWLPEQRTIVFADALTAPRGELRV
jgi:hypothetical protein